MSTAELETLWSRLRTAGLVTGEAPPAEATAAPWYVRLMLGVAGWIGAVFLLIFVGLGLSFVIKSAALSFIFGLGACVGAGLLFRAKPDSDFATQFGLAVSLAGQGLVLFALMDSLHARSSVVALGMSLFLAALFFAIPNFVHRVWSAWTGSSAIVFALVDWRLQAYAPGLLALACAWVWLHEFRYARHGELLRPGAYGLTLSLMGAAGLVAGSAAIGFWHNPPPGNSAPLWPGAALSGLVLLWSVWQLLSREAVRPNAGSGLGILMATLILALATLKAPGLAPATLILLLGHANGNRVLAGLGVAALLGYLSFYYYSLETTLLHKSALMVATGLALLAARLVLHKYWPALPEHQHD